MFTVSWVDTIVAVDLDMDCATKTAQILEMSSDDEYFVNIRRKNLTLDVYRGSITEFDARLADVDAVTMIEVYVCARILMT